MDEKLGQAYDDAGDADSLDRVRTLYVGPVRNERFEPLPDYRYESSPRWRPGPRLLSTDRREMTNPRPRRYINLAPHEGKFLMVMAGLGTDGETIYEADVIGVLDSYEGSMLGELTYKVLQEKEADIENYIRQHPRP